MRIIGLICCFPSLLFSQIWVENIQFSQPGLDPAKWTVTNELRATFNSTSMNVYSLTASGWMPSVSGIQYDLNQRLPLNHSWTVIQRFKCNEIENPGYFMIMSAIIGEENISNYVIESYGPPLEVGDIEISKNTYNWFGLTYEFETRAIRGIASTFSGSETPSIELFQITGQSFSTIGKEDSEAIIHNNVSSVYSSDITITNFNILSYAVPEPSALSLLGIGLGGLAILRRRRS